MGEEEQLGRLNLPPGIDSQQLLAAVVDSGYPLQTRVALDLAEEFAVVEEWGFIDRSSGDHRSLDLLAWRRLEPSDTKLSPMLSMLIECKRSDLPVVVFASAFQRIPPAFPMVAGFHRNRLEIRSGSSRREVDPSTFFCLRDFPFVSNGPQLASSVTKAARKGSDFVLSGDYPYKHLVLPLTSALDYFVESRKPRNRAEWVSPGIVLCVAVVDAPLVVARGTSEKPILESTKWTRVTRQEAAPAGDRWEPPRHYQIDVVHISFLKEYTDRHVLPFAEAVASRMLSRKDLAIAGKAIAPSLADWRWEDLKRSRDAS